MPFKSLKLMVSSALASYILKEKIVMTNTYDQMIYIIRKSKVEKY
jgi:hypothetical protein